MAQILTLHEQFTSIYCLCLNITDDIWLYANFAFQTTQYQLQLDTPQPNILKLQGTPWVSFGL